MLSPINFFLPFWIGGYPLIDNVIIIVASIDDRIASFNNSNCSQFMYETICVESYYSGIFIYRHSLRLAKNVFLSSAIHFSPVVLRKKQ